VDGFLKHLLKAVVFYNHCFSIL
jgi:hypothetical protein